MPRNDDVRFISSSIKLPSLSPPALHHPPPFSFSSLQLNPGGNFPTLPFNFNFQFNFGFNPQPINFITQFVRNQPVFRRNIKNGPFHTVLKKSPLFCSATLALSDSETGPASNELKSGDDSESVVQYKGDEYGAVTQSKSVGSNHDGILDSGYFKSCAAVPVDTGDDIGLIFQERGQVEPNQEFQGLVCEGANVLPSKFIEDAFRDGYGKVINIGETRGALLMVGTWSGVFRASGEPTVGKTRPETILRQLTAKKGQVYSMIQEKRDVDTVLNMGILDDVRIIRQEAGDTGKIDLTVNVVEREIEPDISATSNGITSGPLAGLIGKIEIFHKNLFGRNKQLHLSLERGEIDSKFRIKCTDPWIEGGDKRTSRTIMIENSRTLGNQPNNNGLTIGRITGGIEYSRHLGPNWNGTAGLIFSGNTHDDMLLAKLETVYTCSDDPGSSMFAFNMDQGIPVSPEWPVFNRVNARARQGFVIGPACFLVSLSGGHVVGKLPPHEAFRIGGRNSVRGYEAGTLGSGRSYVVGSGEMSFPVMGGAEGVVFADYGTDLGSGSTVPGDAAGARNKPGSGSRYGIGVRVPFPFGPPLRLEYAFNDEGTGKFHFRIGR
ncbi:Outer envelope protein 80, chloroplastic [Sesamum angolense]|uniref:Outer envelope protein 80, chloroplastic n=1 Tax=Sesamum angolense TaxID=2727404 RepID=A0AAE2BJ76_9LAMI|nr:Outer envelope protein 80, chloroplastic [Sesamum angolense]